jgi:hypothetical protein
MEGGLPGHHGLTALDDADRKELSIELELVPTQNPKTLVKTASEKADRAEIAMDGIAGVRN